MDRNFSEHAKATHSSARSRTVSELRAHLTRLLEPGLMGVFNQVAVYEIFAKPLDGAPLNILTVAVAEEGEPESLLARKEFLTPKPFNIKGFAGWCFGATVKRRLLQSLDDALASLETTSAWALSGDMLDVGVLEPLAPTFAPRDGNVTLPVNRVLRNNGWNGSHVIRLSCADKTRLRPFIEDRRRLQQLSDALRPKLPMSLSAMIDYLGDVLIQVPVTAHVVNMRHENHDGPLELRAVWDPRLLPRPLIASARMEVERAVAGAAVSETFTETVILANVTGQNYPLHLCVWDQQTGLLMAATTPTTFLTQMHTNLRMIEPEPRIFTLKDGAGHASEIRVRVHTHGRSIVSGDSPDTAADLFARDRGQLEEASRLAESREFVQYRPLLNEVESSRERALDDLRELIRRHGERGVDLWDPFLSANDLLETLFFAPANGAPLRALTDRREAPDTKLSDTSVRQPADEDEESGSVAAAVQGCSCTKATKLPREPYAERQRRILETQGGNLYGLNLEFRSRNGPKGWSFHDRFVIFPHASGGPMAWSLGISVNQIGQSHHILQRVGNGALIAGAFNDLWTALDEPIHQVWKSP